MATWYATAAGNINTAGRWNSLPNGAGTAMTWPPASGDVLVANSYVITVNVSVNLGAGELRVDTTGGATTGGYFNCTTAGVSVTANFFGGGGTYVIVWNNSGIGYFVGNIIGGGSANQYGVAILQGTVNATGTVTGGSGTNAWGIFMNAGTVNLTGDAAGGIGADGIRCNADTTSLTVTGNAIAGASTAAITNAFGGPVTVSGYAQAFAAAPAVANVLQGVLSVGETRSASNGRPAVFGAFRYASASALVHKPIAADGSTLTMRPVAAFALPDEATVRNGVSYGADKVGTLTGCNQHHRMSA